MPPIFALLPAPPVSLVTIALLRTGTTRTTTTTTRSRVRLRGSD